MTMDNIIKNDSQNLAKTDNKENSFIISRIEPIIFKTGGQPYTQDQLKKVAPFSHVQTIVKDVTDSINSNVIDALNTTLKAEQAKVTTLVNTIGDKTDGLIKEINDMKSSLEPPPMDSSELL